MSDNSSFNSSIRFSLTSCLESRTTIFIFMSLLIIDLLLLLPLLLFVLYLGLQQWRHHCSGSATSPMSHSDFFTYNMAALDLITILGLVFTVLLAKTLFHVLTCVERYLAVVHPITYLSLRKNGPGEASGNRERVDQSKKKAFHTIVAITASMDINIPVNCSSFVDLPSSFDMSFANLSFDILLDRCSRSTTGVSIFTAFSITNIVVIFPMSFVVLYLGFRQWRQQCSIPTAVTTSNSDIFTYNMVTMLLIEVLASSLYCVGGYANIVEIITFLYDFFCTMWSVKMQFHMLTCVERYLAVVHPVTYHGLKNKGGVRIRRLSIVRPGPGEVGGDKEQVNQLKLRAFHTITAIMGTLLLSVAGVLVCAAIYASALLKYNDSCVVMMSFVLFSVPSSLVLPLLYLHRAGKLPGGTHKNESN
ncbi:hypothetical protein Q8A73_012647 [Channa argus]|nr:hypothetical protein Q8A73_012647 [Channa argus]